MWVCCAWTVCTTLDDAPFLFGKSNRISILVEHYLTESRFKSLFRRNALCTVFVNEFIPFGRVERFYVNLTQGAACACFIESLRFFFAYISSLHV